MKKRFQTAIVGNLQAINVLLPAFQALPQFEVAALCGRDRQRTRLAAAQAGVAATYESWQPLVDDPAIEVVALALPPFLQSQAAIGLARAGKHLFCEKPLAANLAEAEAVRAAVADMKRTAVVNFGFRMVEAFRDFRAIALSGLLGRPEFVMVEWLLSVRRNPALTWNWKSDAAQGGGTLNMMGSHPLDYLRWFFGDILSIRSQTAAILRTRPNAQTGQPMPVRADDTCNLLLKLAPDIPASVTISTVLAVPGSHRVRAWFEKGTLELANSPADDTYDGFKIAFEPAKGTDAGLRGEIERLAVFSQGGHCLPRRVGISQRMAAEFAKALSGQPNLAPTLEDALKVQQSLESAAR
jgi:predicted dehydrogenase